MKGLFRDLMLAAALVALLTTVACGDDGGESTSAPQSTVPATSVGQVAETSPAPPTSAGQGGETSPVPQPTVTLQATPTPETQLGGAIEMGIDVDTTGNTANTLGAVESCVRVDMPNPSFDGVSDYNIDIYVKGDTQPPRADNHRLKWDNADAVHIADPGSESPWNAGVLYMTGGPGIPGDGTLTRIGLDIGGSGVVTFTLSPEPFDDYASDAGNHPVSVDPAGATLAINTDCPQ
jgi:hypothetical protein